MRVVVSGASGLVGRALVDDLIGDGHAVVRLVRRQPTAPDEVSWDPLRHQLDPAALADADAVVHLAGVGIGDQRWTDEYRQLLVRSREDGTATVARAVAEAGTPTLISASAVGYYGDTGNVVVDESSAQGDDFLAELCGRWEAATKPAEDAGSRVVHIRSGLIIARSGGLLGRMRPLFKLGIGGRLGSGKQFWPWISLPDEIAAIRALLDVDTSGAVNLVAPQLTTNAQFTRALAAAVHRPALLPAPAFALRIVLGEFADVGVLAGQRVVPKRLQDMDFRYRHAELGSALRWAVKADSAR